MLGMTLVERDSRIPVIRELPTIAVSVPKEILKWFLLDLILACCYPQRTVISSHRALSGMGEQSKTRRKHNYTRTHPTSLIEA
jgi:hypothetical protein